ncbi:MAG: hypothetical protein WBB45_12595 [Cyclobacteriaceae bacterium]
MMNSEKVGLVFSLIKLGISLIMFKKFKISNCIAVYIPEQEGYNSFYYEIRENVPDEIRSSFEQYNECMENNSTAHEIIEVVYGDQFFFPTGDFGNRILNIPSAITTVDNKIPDAVAFVLNFQQNINMMPNGELILTINRKDFNDRIFFQKFYYKDIIIMELSNELNL